MRRFEVPGPVLFLAVLFVAGFPGCTGTSTESENTLGLHQGRALLAEGGPASGARISLRTRDLVAEGAVLAWRVLDTATADNQGRFELKLPEGREVFLEIREAEPAGPHPRIYFTRYDSAETRPNRFGDLVLTPSGTVAGRLIPAPGAPTENLWIGVAGTSALVRLPGKADSAGLPFRLDGLPAGEHALTVATMGGLAAGPNPPEPPPQAVVEADTVTDAGRVVFEDAISVSTPRPSSLAQADSLASQP